MTGERHPGEEDLILFFYGETDGSEHVGAHIESCDACQANLRALERTLAVVDRHQVAERDDAYAGQVWARVQERLRQPSGLWRSGFALWALGSRPASPRVESQKPKAGDWAAWLAPRRLLLAGSVAVLLVAAFLAGRYSSLPPPVRQTVRAPVAPGAATPAAVATPQATPDRVLLVAVGDHLERSQMVLIEFMNRAADGPVDVSVAQKWARDLVPTNRLIRETADASGEVVVADVLDDLERTLVEIANSPSPLPKAEFERVRQRIDGQSLVFKIRVLDSDVRERETGFARAVHTRS